MLEQIMLATVTSAGSAALAWYLCTQYMASGLRAREEQFKERQHRTERQLAALKARLEARILRARLEEARGMVVLLAGHLPGQAAGENMPIDPPMAFAALSLKAVREPAQRRKRASTLPASPRETLEVCGRSEQILGSNAS